MIYLEPDDPILRAIAGGTQVENVAAVDAAIAAYDYNNPTQGVTNFQHPSTVDAGGVTESSAWMPNVDLYVFENYDASNGKPVDVIFDYNGNGYNPNEMGGGFVDRELTPYGAQISQDPSEDGSIATETVGEWLDEFAAGGGTIKAG
ncbi:hypothetical protein [Gluconacetobacter diazotrophicus]|uniref:Uncharacterized protein n=1 Tax=Gluconacetobacter diazotrophicus TaxID=33996 RepID=A0A7W4I8X1_GLUDI|nr:hypothetical protein [Gluconacetobacter diazotrophicus]MBB2158386.1 hypothetical protein [Gluconacetobacter diazotrophicus]TWB03072.1 hypothetical protein FBZ86_12322 [Gluconacetobacter diazotrophicus]